MADRGQVDPDLVGPSRSQGDQQAGAIGVAVEHPEVGGGGLAALQVRSGRPPPRLGRVTADGAGDRVIGQDTSLDLGQVLPLHVSDREQLLAGACRLRGLGHSDEAAGCAVEAMDRMSSPRTPRHGDRVAGVRHPGPGMPRQHAQHRAASVGAHGVDMLARGLVNHHQVLVLEHDHRGRQGVRQDESVGVGQPPDRVPADHQHLAEVCSSVDGRRSALCPPVHRKCAIVQQGTDVAHGDDREVALEDVDKFRARAVAGDDPADRVGAGLFGHARRVGIMRTGETLDDTQELRFIRRGVAAVVLLALLTLPFARHDVVSGRGWIVPVSLLVLVAAAVAIRFERVQLAAVAGVSGVILYAMSLALVLGLLEDVIARGADRPGMGSAALWVVVVHGPVAFMSMTPRSAWLLHLGGVAIFPAAIVGVWGVSGLRVASDHQGLETLGLTVASIVVIAAVAHTVRVSGEQQAEAVREAARAAQRAAMVAEEGDQRRAALLRAAQHLSVDARDLVRQVSLLSTELATDAWSARGRDLVSRVAAGLAGIGHGTRRTLAEGAVGSAVQEPSRRATDPTPVAPRARALPPAGVLLVPAAVILFLVDLLELARILGSRAVDPGAVAAAGNRMVVVLVLLAATCVMQLSLPRAIGAVALASILHPLVLVAIGLRGAPSLQPALARLVPAWRIGLLSVALLLVMAALVSARSLRRDAAWMARQEALDDAEAVQIATAKHRHESALVAHEVQTPVAVLQGTVETLEQHWGKLTDNVVGELAESMVRASQRLAARADTLLAAALADPALEGPIHAGLLPGRPAREVLFDGIRSAQPALAHCQLRLHLDVDGSEVRVDSDRLEHVLENLFSNARKYGDPREPVVLTAWPRDGSLQVEVASTGGGLSQEDADRIFEPWFRASGSADASGTGLGLAIVRRQVGSWGGESWCRIVAGQTVVGFSIPTAVANVRAAAVSR